MFLIFLCKWSSLQYYILMYIEQLASQSKFVNCSSLGLEYSLLAYAIDRLLTPFSAQDTHTPASVSLYKPNSRALAASGIAVGSMSRVEATITHSGIVSSQNSTASPSSFRPPRLAATSSNVSANTDPDTRQTSPVSSINRELTRDNTRPLTPRSDARAGSGIGSADTSPMSIATSDAALAHGTKRTASGAYKTAIPDNNAIVDNMQPHRVHTRHQSLDSRAGKVGNVSEDEES